MNKQFFLCAFSTLLLANCGHRDSDQFANTFSEKNVTEASGVEAGSPITQEAHFNGILAEAESELQEFAQTKFDLPFEIMRGYWDKEYDPKRGIAGFYTLDSKRGVYVKGFIARLDYMIPSGIDLIICHELGHHLFGGGKEHESDHFVGECLPLLWQDEDNQGIIAQLVSKKGELSTEVKRECKESQHELLCLRTMYAAQATNKLREWVWKKTYSDEKVANLIACRDKLFLDGILGRDFDSEQPVCASL